MNPRPMLGLLIALGQASVVVAAPLGAYMVPGRTVPILNLLEHYASSCTGSDNDDFGMRQLSQIMQSLNAEEVAQKIYNSLFFSIGDINVHELMGKWYTVMHSNSRAAQCAVSQFELLSSGQYTYTFSVVQWWSGGVREGDGRVVGPDPADMFISFGDPADHCPYVPVHVGGLAPDGSFQYIILSQPLKHPTVVLARDPTVFYRTFRKEVNTFLEKYGFMSPVAALNTRLAEVDYSKCKQGVHIV